MSIRLLDYRALKIIFTPSENLLNYLYSFSEIGEDIPSISYEAVFPEDDKNIFFIHFNIAINKADEDHGNFGNLEIDFLARFSHEIEITEKFKDSHFPRVNAPAIAYPFLRAFVNNLFVNAGYETVLLPTYNFTKSVKN
uniref:protein-export chaperone SecB n=1 Tax=Psychrobacter sp. TaxID=56811 RepID=UPI00159728DB|nr:protein-export chaperone SecB [Psychrobacter sp.]QJS05581.1 hypothetical protein [Psychrobacter sp.]